MKAITGMNGMGNARELAEMLRQMGRGRDTVLAHITPEEAEMLIQMGGSGTINPNTGLPEFQDDFDLYGAVSEQQSQDPFYQEPQYEDYSAYETMPMDFVGQPSAGTQEIPTIDVTGGVAGAPQQPMDMDTGFDIGFGADQYTPRYTPRDVAGMAPDQFQRMTAPEPGMLQQIEGKLGNVSEIFQKYPRLAQMAGFTAEGLVGLLQANRARKQGERTAKQISQMTAPIRAQGEALRTQALAGQLTPQQAAQQEAARARARQAAAGRGVTTGTQATMIENQLARSRAQLSETNLSQAMKMLGLANTADEAAIRASLAADREADEILGNILQGAMRRFEAAQQPNQQPPQAPRQTAPRTTPQMLPEGQLFPQPKVRE